MKVRRDCSQTEDLTLCREMCIARVMDLLVDGLGLVVRSVLEIRPTRDGFQLDALVWLVLPGDDRGCVRFPSLPKT
jgi:hypothetical protein